MHDLRACIACLRSDVKIIHMSYNQIREDYNLVAGLKTNSGEGLPEYVCIECLALVRRMKKFRDKCHTSNFLLHQLIRKNKEVTLQVLNEINLKSLNIIPTFSYLNNQSRNSYEKVKFKWTKENRSYVQPIEADVLLHSTVDNEITSYVEVKVDESEFFNSNLEHDKVNEVPIEISIEQTNDEYDDNIEADNELCNDVVCKDESDVDGSNLDEEYAILVPISTNESAAVLDICKTYVQSGKHECRECGMKYHLEKTLEQHRRMHDMHKNGYFKCELCHYYYKTKFLLKTHITEKHMYKYICKKCPEVTFDRPSAKKHFIANHIDKGNKTDDWYDTRPSWLKKKCPNGKSLRKPSKTVHAMTRTGFEFLKYSPIGHNEQYNLVLEKKFSKNYVESLYKCDMCYKGFREPNTYQKHMQKHDPSISGRFQCDPCKIYCTDLRKLYKHMVQAHLYKFTCQLCSFVSLNRWQAKIHYLWHKDVTYACPHCDKVYKKSSTRLTHIRLKHPSLHVCGVCGHSFVSENGLLCHKRIAHRDAEDGHDVKTADAALFCVDCNIQFQNADAYDTHLGSSGNHSEKNVSVMKAQGSVNQKCRAAKKSRKRRHFSEVLNKGTATETNCEICDKLLLSDTQARRHYEAEHPGSEFRKRYMCDICGHTTRQYSNLLVHMRTHTREKPYECPHCARRFSMPSNRDRHLVVHTGEKRHVCPHCARRFSQRTAMKLHVQTVHLKIPYAPWNKSNRKRRQRDEEGATIALPAKLPPLVTETHDYLNAYISYNE